MSQVGKERLESLVRKHYKKSSQKPKSKKQKQKEILELISNDEVKCLATIAVIAKNSEEVFLAEATEYGIKKTLKQAESLLVRYYGNPYSSPDTRLKYEVFVFVSGSRLEIPFKIWKEFSSFDKQLNSV